MEPVSFAILTANAKEEMAVNHFLELDSSITNDNYPHATGCVWSHDSYAQQQKHKKEEVKIVHVREVQEEEEEDRITYRVFSLEVNQVKTMGVHFYCNSTGPWGAFDKTLEILKEAKKQGWKLDWIFLIGCCGASISDGKKKDIPRGTVLVAKQVKEYLYKGKVETAQGAGASADEQLIRCSIKGEPLVYDVQKTKWFRDLQKAKETKWKVGNDMIRVQTADYLCGPLVIKDSMFSSWFREQSADVAGVEMEVVGVIKAVEAFHFISGSPKPKILLAKGISDYTGRKGESATCMLFGRVIGPVSDDALQVYATLQSIALVIRFMARRMSYSSNSTS